MENARDGKKKRFPLSMKVKNRPYPRKKKLKRKATDHEVEVGEGWNTPLYRSWICAWICAAPKGMDLDHFGLK